MLRPLPGITGDRLLTVLRELEAQAGNVRSETSFGKRLAAYIKWANQTANALGLVAMPEDVNRLVTTPRYWTLHTVDATSQRDHHHLLDLEIEERIRAFNQEVAACQRATKRWQLAGVLIVPDTNVFLHHEDLFTAIDWPTLAEARMSDVVLVLPLIVIDELDRAKRGQQRSRARQSLKIIGDLFRSGTGNAPEIAAATPSTGAVRCLLVTDEPGHVRLPIADDEIVDQARVLHDFTERPVKIASFDTGMHLRTRLAGLDAIELDPAQQAGT